MPLTNNYANIIWNTLFPASSTTYVGLTSTTLDNTSTMADVFSGEPVSNADYSRNILSASDISVAGRTISFPVNFQSKTVSIGPVSYLFVTDSPSGDTGTLIAYSALSSTTTITIGQDLAGSLELDL